MKRVGVTGGIGSGKSFVCRRIAAMGYPVYDCDSEAKRLMSQDADLVKELKALIGQAAFSDGRINKDVVADFLFRSADHAAKVNALVHPAVRKDFVRWAALQNTPLVFIESAILHQAQFDTLVDKVICVTAPYDMRIQRVVTRDYCTAEAVEQRVSLQMEDEEMQRHSDYIVNNNGIYPVDYQLKTIIQNILSC